MKAAKEKQFPVADFVTTQLTTARAVCAGNNRSPNKVARLLTKLRAQGVFEVSLAWLEENDTQLWSAAKIVREHCAGNKNFEEQVWGQVLQNLAAFAEQSGKWKLCDKTQIVDLFRSATTPIQTRTKN